MNDYKLNHTDINGHIQEMEQNVEAGTYVKVKTSAGWRYQKASNASAIDKKSIGYRRSVAAVKYNY